MTHGLASVFVNNQRVEDLDNPELTIRDIIEAYGRNPESCIVYRLRNKDDEKGQAIDVNERIDLAGASGPVLLRCETRRPEAGMAESAGAAAWSPEGPAHARGGASRRSFDERPQGPRWERAQQEPAGDRPTPALGSEGRSPRRSRPVTRARSRSHRSQTARARRKSE